MFQLSSSEGNSDRIDSIMFEQMSAETQKLVLSFKEIEKPSDKHWDVCPIAFIHGEFDMNNQDDIDNEVLGQIGYHRYKRGRL